MGRPHGNTKDIQGKTFGRLTVVAYKGRTATRKSLWECRCVCGNSLVVIGSSLRNGNTSSCGCARSYTPEEAEAAFWEKINKDGPEHPTLGKCWIWTGAKLSFGYGHLSWKGKFRVAHHVAYELLIGPVPPDLETDHLCRTPACVNPAHLEPVTHRVNVLRGVSPFAKRARQTHCKRGHEFTPENTYIHKSLGVRVCRACHRQQVAEKQKRKRKRSDSA